MKISKDWLKMSEVYKIFAHGINNLDFSQSAKEEAYLYESRGIGNGDVGVFTSGKINAYLYGKKLLNITVVMWKEDIEKGLLYMVELYYPKGSDKEFPHWWLNKIFNRSKSPINFEVNYV